MSDEERKVSDLELLIANGPRLVGVTGANEKRWADRFHGAFLDEILNKASLWAAEEGETIQSRLDILKGLFMATGANQAKVRFWIDLITLKAHTHAIVEHGREDLVMARDTLAEMLRAEEVFHPEFAQYMTVDSAATQGQWA